MLKQGESKAVVLKSTIVALNNSAIATFDLSPYFYQKCLFSSPKKKTAHERFFFVSLSGLFHFFNAEQLLHLHGHVFTGITVHYGKICTKDSICTQDFFDLSLSLSAFRA